ncbi:hypothetical protein GCM10010168_57610 [Actinoplanes ianthinogenes]|uniref:FtsK domain-containing protein n=1 Tax=Actinoplanes ianthinogenes TaxID=122358 RepID=A0ABM7M2M2_9ACTN|nr:type VII secretion protein EccCb [Actinoplanes ianthinogenes]BCJ45819.1 hypothetical protein Aiant_64760 [Actinoplanes ianthinogenes]GGR31791.1 hypothetical protein GCM10010168_57610 [Actinoplanes ianthinogenes]
MSAWTRSSRATQVLYDVRTGLPPGALDLACHAAVPVVLDVGFLHLLRINFFLDPPVSLGHEVEAELLNSAMFQEVGDGLYEVEAELRGMLLAALESAYGTDRLKKVALLLEQYTDHSDPWSPRELDFAQRLTALSMINPGRAADWLEFAQQATAGSDQLGREWFVAMRERLDRQESRPDSLAYRQAELLDELASFEGPPGVDALTELGRLSLLPGVDLTAVLRALDELEVDDGSEFGVTLQRIRATLAGLAPAAEPVARRASLDDEFSLLELLGIEDLSAARISALWNQGATPLFVSFGLDENGATVNLVPASGDPHALIVGIPGSGRSELLRTLVLSLALYYSPEQVRLLLIDSHGSALFNEMDRLPHTTGLVVNPAGDPALLDRLLEVIDGELDRRRANYRSLTALPHLFIVCDEIVSLLNANPEAEERILAVARDGPALNICLILATQSVQRDQLRGLDGELTWRIALAGGSTAESEAVLGSAAARDLPGEPGFGLLRHGGDQQLTRFRAAYVSGPVSAPGGGRPRRLAEVAVNLLSGMADPVPRIWLPPLGGPGSLDAMDPVTIDVERGLQFVHRSDRPALTVPIGIVDLPREGRRDLLTLDFGGDAYHVGIVGGAGSGTSAALRTVVLALALSHTPEEVQIYCLSPEPGTFDELRDLPHVGGVFDRRNPDGVKATLDKIIYLFRQRHRQHGGLAFPRDLRHGGHGHVFLVLDDPAALRASALEALSELVRGRIGHGIHLVAGGSRWQDLPMPPSGLPESQLELRLDRPDTSAINARAAARVPAHWPGHGITRPASPSTAVRHFVIAQPDLTRTPTAQVVNLAAVGWPGRGAPRIEVLPNSFMFAELTAELGLAGRIPIGLRELDNGRMEVDTEKHPSFLVFGAAEAGRTTFLWNWATWLIRRWTPLQARMLVIDYGRGLVRLADAEHVLGYAVSASHAMTLVRQMADALTHRLPGPEITPEELRTRSWWTGPELFVLVDDYELVASAPGNPLAPLVDLLPHARDIGLHLVLARRTGGAREARLTDPVLQQLRETDAPGLVMSGDPADGALIGNVRPEPMPPGRARFVVPGEPTQWVQLARRIWPDQEDPA